MTLSLVALLLLADPKAPPACDASTKGLAWNFGTFEAPNVRLCDGIGFVPLLTQPPAVTAAPAAAEKQPVYVPNSDRVDLSAAAQTRPECLSGCRDNLMICVKACGTFFSQICKGHCTDEDTTCSSRCAAKFSK